MIVAEGVKTEGEHWDEELDLYLDVDATIQRWPFWWDQRPDEYEKLLEKREAAGIEFEDELFTDPEDQEGLEDGLSGDDDE